MMLSTAELLQYAEDMRRARAARGCCLDCEVALETSGRWCSRHRGACACGSDDPVVERDERCHEDGVHEWVCAVCATPDTLPAPTLRSGAAL